MSLKVMIVGAGIGGLCLAQGLSRAGIAVEVYERGADRDASSWLQGYQIHVDPTGTKALKACLPSSVYALFEAHALRPGAGVQVLTEDLRVLATLPPALLAGSRPVTRSVLRTVLLEGMQDTVTFGKTVTHVQSHPDKVQAHFSDGSTCTADLLVAADGIDSTIRRQYLPATRITDTGLTGIAGKVFLDQDTRTLLPESLLSRLTSILGPGGTYMVITQSLPPNPTPTTTITQEPGHLIWVLITHNHRRAGQTPTAVKDLADQRLTTWHPVLRDLVAATDPATIAAVPIRTCIPATAPLASWEPTNVTLLGDAIHPMTPLQGLGGSTALRDADQLRRRLLDVHHGTLPLAEAVTDYERTMLDYGLRAVRTSLRFTNLVTSSHPATRALFKTGLRIANRLPALHHLLIRARS